MKPRHTLLPPSTAILLLCLLCALPPLRGQDVKPKDAKKFASAVELIQQRKYREGAAQMRRLASQNPQSADCQYWLGIASVRDGFNTTGIRRYFSKCIALQPSYPAPLAHYYMALILYTDDHFEEAVAELQQYFDLSAGSDDRAVNSVYEEASNYLYWSQFLSEAQLNTVPFNPVRVEGVSSQHNELMPYLTPDGQTFYYLRQVPIKQAPTFYNRELEQKQWQLFSSTWRDTAFSRGLPLPKPFNSGLPEGSVSLTADGNELYFSIITNNKGYANSDIYCVKRIDGLWQEPENCGPQVNGEHSWESQPSVSPDGQRLIFASNRKGGAGGIDLWQCHRLPDGSWSRAANLGTAINTPANEKAPFLAADGQTLYFLSDGWQGFGGYDIYFSNLLDPAANRPTNLGLPINSEADELSFGVTADGTQAYFATKQEGSRSSDVYLFDLYPAARPAPMGTASLSADRPFRIATLSAGQWQTTATACKEATVMASLEENTPLLLIADSCLPTVLTLTPRDVRAHKPLIASFTPLSIEATAAFCEADGAAWVAWLVEHPRVHLCIECPKAAQAEAIMQYFKQQGLRAERFEAKACPACSGSRMRVIAL